MTPTGEVEGIEELKKSVKDILNKQKRVSTPSEQSQSLDRTISSPKFFQKRESFKKSSSENPTLSSSPGSSKNLSLFFNSPSKKVEKTPFEELLKSKILLLGCEFAGKSTVFYQIQRIQNISMDKEQFIAKIRYNCYQISEVLCKLKKIPNFEFESLDWPDFLPSEKSNKTKMLNNVIKLYQEHPEIIDEFAKTGYYYDGSEQ